MATQRSQEAGSHYRIQTAKLTAILPYNGLYFPINHNSRKSGLLVGSKRRAARGAVSHKGEANRIGRTGMPKDTGGYSPNCTIMVLLSQLSFLSFAKVKSQDMF